MWRQIRDMTSLGRAMHSCGESPRAVRPPDNWRGISACRWNRTRRRKRILCRFASAGRKRLRKRVCNSYPLRAPAVGYPHINTFFINSRRLLRVQYAELARALVSAPAAHEDDHCLKKQGLCVSNRLVAAHPLPRGASERAGQRLIPGVERLAR